MSQLLVGIFNIVIPPLSLPTAVSLDQEVDTNKELVAHGYSNILAGFFGLWTLPLGYLTRLRLYRNGP